MASPSTLTVRELPVLACSVPDCTNQQNGGRMVTVEWGRQPYPRSSVINKLVLCSPCWGSLDGEISALAVQRHVNG